MKISRTLFVSALLAAGCGQPYTPEPKEHIAGPTNPGGIFDTDEQSQAYQMLTYELLRATLRGTLELGDTIGDTGPCTGPGVDVAETCPVANPLGYLDANADQLGAAVYDEENPQQTSGPRLLTSGGFKVWMLAASSACGRMMNEQAVPALFPNDFPGGDPDRIEDYDVAFLTLMGRLPTEAEVARLDTMQDAPQLANLSKRGAAVCTAILGNLEFLGSN